MSYNYDPELQSLLEFLPDTSLGIHDPVKARAGFLELIALLNADVDRSGVAIENRSIPGPVGAPDVPVRIYSPEGLDKTVPGILHIHGGGFVIGDLDSELGSCVALCRNPGRGGGLGGLPAGAGDTVPGSARGLLCCPAMDEQQQRATENRPRTAGRVRTERRRRLVSRHGTARQGSRRSADMLPVPGHSRTGRPPANTKYAALCRYPDVEPAQRRTQLGFLPRRPVPARCGRCALPCRARPGPRILSGLPPAYVSTMEFDPLRDEGVEYALKLMRQEWPPNCTAFPAPFTAPAFSLPPRSVGASRQKCSPSCAAHCALTPEKTD